MPHVRLMRPHKILGEKYGRFFLFQGQTIICDKGVTGSKRKLYRCSGCIMAKGEKGVTGGQVLVRGCKRTQTTQYRYTNTTPNSTTHH